MGLKKEDLIEGEIYLYDNSHIIKYPEGIYITPESNNYQSCNSLLWSLKIKEATPEQKAHLNACIAADKYVDKPNITKKDLIAEAKRRYPAGSKFDNSNLRLNCSYLIEKSEFEILSGEVIIKAKNLKSGCGWYTLYKDGKWADTVEENPIFEVGDTVEVLDTLRLRKWNRGAKAIGHTFTLGNTDIERLNVKGYCYEAGKNTYSINYKLNDLKIIKKNKVKQDKVKKDEYKDNNKKDSSNLQRVNQSIRGASSSRRARLASSKEQVKFGGTISGNQKRPSFSSTRAY